MTMLAIPTGRPGRSGVVEGGKADMVVVYVDDWRRSTGEGRRARRWSHLFADRGSELDRFGRRLGIPREWRHDGPSGVHYDLTDAMRPLAVKLGAVEIRLGSSKWRAVVRQARRTATRSCGSRPGRVA
jgi:hypothetical protein